jgi:hypothetical protein
VYHLYLSTDNFYVKKMHKYLQLIWFCLYDFNCNLWQRQGDIS